MPVAHNAAESGATSLPLLKDSGLCIQGCVLGFQKLISRCHIWAACLGSSLGSVLLWKECPAPPFGAKLCHTPGWLVALYLTWPLPEGPASTVLTQSPVCPHWHSAPGLPLWDAQPQPGLPTLVWMNSRTEGPRVGLQPCCRWCVWIWSLWRWGSWCPTFLSASFGAHFRVFWE